MKTYELVIILSVIVLVILTIIFVARGNAEEKVLIKKKIEIDSYRVEANQECTKKGMEFIDVSSDFSNIIYYCKTNSPCKVYKFLIEVE